MIRCDGHAPDGTHVRVAWDSSPYQAEVWINGEGIALGRHNVRVFRDGGTVHIDTPAGVVVFPHRIGEPDRTPRLNGAPIEE